MTLANRYSREEILDVLERADKLFDAAKALSCSPRTLKKYARMYGHHYKRQKKRSCLTRWVAKHPRKLLPQSVKEIITLTGCSKDAVVSYLYRRRVYEKRRLRKLPDLKTSWVVLKTTDGRRIPTYWFERYMYYLNRYTFKIMIKAKLKNGQLVTIKTSRKRLEEFCYGKDKTTGNRHGKDGSAHQGNHTDNAVRDARVHRENRGRG